MCICMDMYICTPAPVGPSIHTEYPIHRCEEDVDADWDRLFTQEYRLFTGVERMGTLTGTVYSHWSTALFTNGLSYKEHTSTHAEGSDLGGGGLVERVRIRRVKGLTRGRCRLGMSIHTGVPPIHRCEEGWFCMS